MKLSGKFLQSSALPFSTIGIFFCSPKLEFYVRCVQIFKTRRRENCSTLLIFFWKKEYGYKRVLWQPQFLISFCINEFKNGNMCGWLTLVFFLSPTTFLQPFVSRDFSNNYFHSHTSLRDESIITNLIYLLFIINYKLNHMRTLCGKSWA